MWIALEQCHLKSHVEGMEGKLDAHIDEGGSNLSAGQRQLMCLGVRFLFSLFLFLASFVAGLTQLLTPSIARSVRYFVRARF